MYVVCEMAREMTAIGTVPSEVPRLDNGAGSKKCPMCTFKATSLSLVISHIRTVHSSDPNFRVPCGLDGCATTSKSFPAFYSHIYRHHTDVIKKRDYSREMKQGTSTRCLPTHQANHESSCGDFSNTGAGEN